MRGLKNIWSQLHNFLLWALVAVLFWVWIYSVKGDPAPEKKVTVFVKAVALEDSALSLKLEEELPEGIERVKVHDFSYDLFGGKAKGDIYIVPESVLRRVLEQTPEAVLAFTPPAGSEPYIYKDSCVGLKIYDGKTGSGAGANVYIRYARPDETAPEDYYICFGTETIHMKSAENGIDNAAWEIAQKLLRLEQKAD